MNLKWNPRMAVGVSVIDRQHMELSNRFTTLFDALASGQNRLELVDALRSLESCLVSHFETEEEVMDCHSYSAASAHKAQHAEFEEQFASFKDQLFNADISMAAAVDLLERLADWQANHIAYTDYELGRYLKLAKIIQVAA